jgi:hypothetical protein
MYWICMGKKNVVEGDGVFCLVGNSFGCDRSIYGKEQILVKLYLVNQDLLSSSRLFL